MQQRNTGNLLKRSRYYQAQLDVSLLEPGSADFNLLNDSCFILIAPFDIFGRGLYRYTFEGVCRECSDLKLNDGAVRVFINTKGTKFGKSFAAKMLCAYYDKSCDSRSLFEGLEIAGDPSFEEHLNSHDVIYLDITWLISICEKDRNVVEYILFREQVQSIIRTLSYRR